MFRPAIESLTSPYEKLKRAAVGLPDIVESTSYGTPALKAGKKLLCRIKDSDTVVVMCPLEEKEMLMEAAPDLYFETDHYRGWPAMLVRIQAIPLDELRVCLERAWLMQATRTMVKARDAARVQ